MNLAEEVFGAGAYLRADMHCHLDFAPDPAGFARAAQRAGVAAFSNTVTPAGFLAARATLGGFANVRVGVGVHPWWLADSRCPDADVELACELARRHDFVGEVGLDFSPRWAGTFELQTRAFERLMQACAGGGKVVSIHAVRAAGAVLDILERTGAARANACILHWFSGTSDELARGRALGCRFSLGTRMLATKRGRAYARQLPPEARLLETDLPDDPARGPAEGASDPQTWLNDLASADEALRMV